MPKLTNWAYKNKTRRHNGCLHRRQDHGGTKCSPQISQDEHLAAMAAKHPLEKGPKQPRQQSICKRESNATTEAKHPSEKGSAAAKHPRKTVAACIHHESQTTVAKLPLGRMTQTRIAGQTIVKKDIKHT